MQQFNEELSSGAELFKRLPDIFSKLFMSSGKNVRALNRSRTHRRLRAMQVLCGGAVASPFVQKTSAY